MEQLERLRALTEADRWIERVIAQREHLPELEELATLEGELRSLLDALKEAQATAEPVRRRYATLQESSQRLGQRASDLEKALAAATGSARDLAAMSREHEQVRTRLAETEDEELDAMLELEPLDETINAIKGRAQPGVARRAELQAHVAQLRATLDEEIAALRASRQELAHGLEPQWRQRYDAALARVGTSGAAMVDAGRCDGCRIALSPLDYDRYKHLEPGVVMDCPECGRLLLP
jgi:predicted  nucleic acid-binding Zn-ribbon protein